MKPRRSKINTVNVGCRSEELTTKALTSIDAKKKKKNASAHKQMLKPDCDHRVKGYLNNAAWNIFVSVPGTHLSHVATSKAAFYESSSMGRAIDRSSQ